MIKLKVHGKINLERKNLPMNYLYLLKHPHLFPAVIGITYAQFLVILNKFVPALRKAEKEQACSFERVRIPGGGRKSKLLTDKQKLFFLLFYYKNYPTYDLAQALFGIDASNLYRWKAFLEQVFQSALGYQLQLPVVRVKTLAGLREVCPVLKDCIVDATERPIERPGNNQIQQDHYSGKKKRHTVKNQIILHAKNNRILAVSDQVEGKMHDKKLLEIDGTLILAPPKAIFMGDLGYLGASEINPTIKFVTPLKKPQGQELSDADKTTNKAISSIRVRVEHPFAYLKHFAILRHNYRGAITKAQLPFLNLACTYNFVRNYH